jgi:hypothetical protein
VRRTTPTAGVLYGSIREDVSWVDEKPSGNRLPEEWPYSGLCAFAVGIAGRRQRCRERPRGFALFRQVAMLQSQKAELSGFGSIGRSKRQAGQYLGLFAMIFRCSHACDAQVLLQG